MCPAGVPCLKFALWSGFHGLGRLELRKSTAKFDPENPLRAEPQVRVPEGRGRSLALHWAASLSINSLRYGFLPICFPNRRARAAFSSVLPLLRRTLSEG